MENTDRYYYDMLLRQYPFLKDHLGEDEYPIAFSYRKPNVLQGISLLFTGSLCVLDTLIHIFSENQLLMLAIFLLGLILSYAGYWTLVLSGRSYAAITNRRILFRKIDLLGRSSELLSIDRSMVSRVRFLKSTVMYRAKRSDGSLQIRLSDGKDIVLPDLADAETLLSSLR